MTEGSSEQQLVTRLLKQWGSGNKAALDELMPLVYEQLRKLASICLSSSVPTTHCVPPLLSMRPI